MGCGMRSSGGSAGCAWDVAWGLGMGRFVTSPPIGAVIQLSSLIIAGSQSSLLISATATSKSLHRSVPSVPVLARLFFAVVAAVYHNGRSYKLRFGGRRIRRRCSSVHRLSCHSFSTIATVSSQPEVFNRLDRGSDDFLGHCNICGLRGTQIHSVKFFMHRSDDSKGCLSVVSVVSYCTRLPPIALD